MKKENNRYIVPWQNGQFIFKLEEQLQKKGKSKYRLSKDLNTEYKVINRYVYGDLSKLDLDVIARLCDACECDISDLIEYKRKETK